METGLFSMGKTDSFFVELPGLLKEVFGRKRDS